MLYAPCVAVLGAVHKEAGLHWTILVFSWSTGLAYHGDRGVSGWNFGEHPLFSSLWIASMVSILWVFINSLKRLSSKIVPNNLIQTVQI